MNTIDLEISPRDFGTRPSVTMPDNSIYKILGENGIRKMISDHYDLLVESEISHLFPPKGKPLDMAKQRSADFIIQRFGGPNYFDQRRGSPMLVKRHAPFKITPETRIVWLGCYRDVLIKQPLPKQVIIDFWRYLDEFSNWMVNTQA